MVHFPVIYMTSHMLIDYHDSHPIDYVICFYNI